jgi:hypothetical protein
MQRFSGRRSFLFAFLACLAVRISSAADHKLLSLVSPGAQAVARIGAPSTPSSTSNFVVISHYNGVDLGDFFAVSGADSARSVQEVILVAAADSTGRLNEHSLLASGNFDRDRIYRSAIDSGSSTTRYGGVSVLVVQPFARERSDFSEVRWLAIPEPSVLLFGSIGSVQQELDRYLTRSSVDPRLEARLSRLRRDDETWCVLSPLTWTQEIRDVLAVIDPKLAAGLKGGDAFQFGIRYGRRVEFEYEITTNSSAATRSISDLLTQSLVGPEKGLALLPPIDLSTDNNTVRGLIKVSMTRYNAWLAEVSPRGKSTVFR